MKSRRTINSALFIAFRLCLFLIALLSVFIHYKFVLVCDPASLVLPFLDKASRDFKNLFAGLPHPSEMAQNIRLIFKGYSGGYARSLKGYAVFILIASFFISSGRYFLRLIFRADKSAENPIEALNLQERISMYYLLGSWISALLWFILGNMGRLDSSIAWLMGFIGFGMLAAGCWSTISKRKKSLLEDLKVFFHKLTLKEKGLLAALSFILILYSAIAFRPPEHPDALLHHAALPNFYIQEGRVTVNPYDYYSYFTQNTEMIVLWAFILKSDFAAQLLIWGFWVSLALFVWGFLRRITEEWIALCSVFIVMSAPIMIYSAAYIKPDLPCALFVFAHYCVLFEALKRCSLEPEDSKNIGNPETWIFLSGILAGGAAGHKMSALYIGTLSSITVLGVDFYRTIKLKIKTKPLMLYWSAGLIAPLLPWFLRNFIVTGNPVYPYLGRLFGVRFDEVFYQTGIGSVSIGTQGLEGVRQYILGLFTGNAMPDVPQWGPSLLFLSLLPFFFWKSCSASLRLTLGTAIVTTLAMHVWLEPRYHMGSLAFLTAVPFAMAWNEYHQVNSSRKNGFMVGGIILLMSYQLIQLTMMMRLFRISAAHIIAGYNPENYAAIDHEELLNARWIYHLINTRTPKNDKVLFAGSSFPYGLQRKMIYNWDAANEDPFCGIAKVSATAEEMKNHLRDMKIEHVVMSNTFYEQFRNHPLKNFRLSDSEFERVQLLLQKYMVLRSKSPDRKLAWFSLRSDENPAPLALTREDAQDFPLMYLSEAREQISEGNIPYAQNLLESALSVPMAPKNKQSVHQLLDSIRK